MTTAISYRTADIRFPTSLSLDGSDAMNPDPDYSAAYLTLETDAPDRLEGHSFVFTIGRGNEVQLAGVEAAMALLARRDIESLLDDMGSTWKMLVHDSQLRWLGPEAGVIHMAIGAVVNALWDLKAKRAGLPLWQLLSRMTPEALVDLVDFRYLTDVLTPSGAHEILERALPGRSARERVLLANGYPAYTTSPGWLGYSDEKLARLCRQAVAPRSGGERTSYEEPTRARATCKLRRLGMVEHPARSARRQRARSQRPRDLAFHVMRSTTG